VRFFWRAATATRELRSSGMGERGSDAAAARGRAAHAEAAMSRRLAAGLACGVAIVLPFVPILARGQSAPEPAAAALDPVVVTAARGPQRLSDLTADVTVIGRDEIARAGSQSLAELLQRQPGIQISMNGGAGSTSAVFLRGVNGNQTLVLIDGMRVGSATAGATALEAIPLDLIDHIEILRGPASSLYGADAVGGVIQIFTRRGEGAPALNASASFGTYGTSQATAGIGGSSGAWRYALQGGYQGSRGFDAIANPTDFSYNPDRDGYDRGNASANVSYRIDADHQMAAQYYYSRLDNRFDAGAGYNDRTVTTVETFAVSSTDQLASFWASRLSLGQGSDNSVSQTGYGTSGFRTRQNQLTWQNDLTLPVGALSLAYVGLDERIATDPAFPVTSRRTNSAVGVYRMRVDPHTLQLNVRYDDSSQYGGRTTGALGYAYSIGDGWRALVNLGNAFKAPTFNDLYYPGFANPSLAPETARTADVALEYSTSALVARATAYRNEVKDLIVFQCDANFDCAPDNVAKATLTGLTLQVQADWQTVALKGSFDLLRPEDDATGKNLPRRARRYGSASALAPWDAWQFGAELVAASARYDDVANTRRMGGYALVNLTANYALSKQWSLTLRADNILDKHYELAAGYNMAGASIFGGVRYAP
jgi:vitamin B12 transporter